MFSPGQSGSPYRVKQVFGGSWPEDPIQDPFRRRFCKPKLGGKFFIFKLSTFSREAPGCSKRPPGAFLKGVKKDLNKEDS